MTYGELKTRVLMLLNQYSVAGSTVAASYNNQQDYINRIAQLANSAINEIATTTKKIPALLELDPAEGTEVGKALRFTLPSDFYQFRTGDSFQIDAEGRLLHTHMYRLMSKRYVMIPRREMSEGGRFVIGYYRYPVFLPPKPEDSTVLDNDPETHDAVAFYVAAYLVIQDDPFHYASFYNEYRSRLEEMGPGVSAEFVPMD